MSEQLKVSIAVGVSLLLHTLLGLLLLLASFRAPLLPSPAQLIAPREIELVVQTPPEIAALAQPTPPPARVVHTTLDTDAMPAATAPPERPIAESDKDTQAASERPATGDASLPSQEGKERPRPDFANQRYSLGEQTPMALPDAAPAATPAPTPENSKPLFTPTPIPSPAANDFALGKPTPVPQLTPQPQITPQPRTSAAQPRELALLQPRPTPVPRPQTGYRPEREKTRIEGSISNRGKSSIAAIGTPLGRYNKAISDAVGSRWYYYVGQRADLFNIGEVKVNFFVTGEGKAENARLVSNSANATFGEFCLRSVTEAKMPPMPPELATTLSDGRYEVTYTFTLYAQ